MSVLVVAALREEVAHVSGVEMLVTGVGKAVAAAALARRLATPPVPRLVVNIGTAGAVGGTHPGDGAIEIGYVTQHDFPYAAIEELVGPVVRGYALVPDAPPVPARGPAPGTLAVATGDVFVADADRAARIAATGVHLVDMEAFAYAATCASFGVPMRCVKAVSDSADTGASLSWMETVDLCARELAAWVARHISTG